MTALDVSQYDGRQDVFEHGWNLPIDHWSPSSLAMLQRCPRAWQQRYIHGRKERPAEAPVTGTAVHTGIETNFVQKIDSHEDLAPVDLLDAYMEVIFPKTVLAEQEKSGVEVLWDTSAEDARLRGRRMLSEYHNVVAPRVQPIAVELSVETNFGLPVPVVGRVDVERETSVIDIKTGKQATRKPKESWRIQAAVYGHARNKPVEFHSVAAKTSNVTITTPLESEDLLVHPTLAERMEIARSIKALSDLACFFMARYGVERDWPTLGTLHSWACGYCGYIGDCPAWKGRV